MGMFDKMAKKMMENAMGAVSSMDTSAIVDSFTGGGAETLADPIEATGTVAEVVSVDGHSSLYVRSLPMIVNVAGHEPYAARPTTGIPPNKIPVKGQTLPLLVERGDLQRIVVLWDQVQTGLESSLAEARAAAESSAPRPAAAGADDLVAQLERLGTLRASGAISEDEFSALKARLIGG